MVPDIFSIRSFNIMAAKPDKTPVTNASSNSSERSLRYFSRYVANFSTKSWQPTSNLFNTLMDDNYVLTFVSVVQNSVDDENNELILPKSEQIPGDFYRKGEMIRAVVLRVDNQNNNPKIYLSRTAPDFLRRLMEEEVPEITDGLITIKGVARIPGERAKVAVESYDDRIDPVGACVGVRGRRIHGIVHELHNENIDVVNFTTNQQLYIERALSPAQITTVYLDEENKKAEVYLKPKEVSLAIGKGGLNIKLACMLTGYTIDVFRENDSQEEDDIYLDEFNDEIDQWVIDTIKDAGWKTAREVLSASREVLLQRTDLEEDTIDNVLKILKEEFEKD